MNKIFSLKRISILVFVIGFSFSVFAANDALENQVREIAHKLRCPTCQGLSVKESEAGLAVNMKAKIRSLLEEGKSESDVLEFFLERYGEWILRSPPKSGFNMLLWFLPGTIIILAILILFILMKKKEYHVSEKSAVALTAEEEAQIEKELRQLEKN